MLRACTHTAQQQQPQKGKDAVKTSRMSRGQNDKY